MSPGVCCSLPVLVYGLEFEEKNILIKTIPAGDEVVAFGGDKEIWDRPQRALRAIKAGLPTALAETYFCSRLGLNSHLSSDAVE